MAAFWVYPLIAHGILAGLDVVINHELVARLPKHPELWQEVRLHSLRELIFAAIFGGLAWFEWHGVWAFVLIGLFLGEVLISTVDTVLELDVRRLPVFERVLHVLLFVNLGLIMALLSGDVAGWIDQPTGFARTDHGILSWILSLEALGALAWCIRDAVSQRRLKREFKQTQNASQNA